MKITSEDYLILPDEELREKFKHDKIIQKLISLPMLVLVYFFVVFVPEVVLSGISDGIIAFSSAAAFVTYSFIYTDDPAVHKKRVLASDVFQALLLVLGLFATSSITTSFQLGMLVGSNLANYFFHPVMEDMYVLRNHPRYPFDNWRRDDSYISSISSNGTGEERALKRIENTLNAGRVQSVGGEEFFEGEKKKYELPKPDPEKNLQQRKQVWRQHDKADTGYTLDNINKMYFDAPDEGELSGEELERQLMKATAPKKPQEPPEEDFFQSSPVVWRTNKDGTTTMERRSPGSKPAGENDSRTVLM